MKSHIHRRLVHTTAALRYATPPSTVSIRPFLFLFFFFFFLGGALDGARELAARIGANGPLAVRASKQVIVSSPDWNSAEMWERQAEILGPVLSSEDAREGAAAFAEKRAPVWKGR